MLSILRRLTKDGKGFRAVDCMLIASVIAFAVITGISTVGSKL